MLIAILGTVWVLFLDAWKSDDFWRLYLIVQAVAGGVFTAWIRFTQQGKDWRDKHRRSDKEDSVEHDD